MKKIKIRLRGRPGWHIECSVMAQKFLKTETLDIHAGGRDLVFPHHENEIAQAEELTGKPFSKYWIHHGLLTINRQKMAKSSSNFITIKNFIAQYKDADLLKLFFLGAHYSHPIDYTDERIEAARQALERIAILVDKIDGRISRPQGCKVASVKEIEEIKSKFFKAMDDDFNTPQAVAAVFELVNAANKNIEDDNFISASANVLRGMLSILGISVEKKGSVDSEITALIKKRAKARKDKDFALSDRIRKELEEKGVILEDSKEGTTWRWKI